VDYFLLMWLAVGCAMAVMLDPEPEYTGALEQLGFYMLTVVVGPPVLAAMLLRQFSGRL
jgi:hypothetical protein